MHFSHYSNFLFRKQKYGFMECFFFFIIKKYHTANAKKQMYIFAFAANIINVKYF